MLEKYCDILVIGTELPGLITAAFLARRGLNVQVIDPSPYSEKPDFPDPVCLTNVHSKLLRSIMGRLNVPEIVIQNFNSRESTLQIVTPQHRIDVSANPLNLYDELDREFPQEHEHLKRFLENQARIRHQTDINALFQLLLPTNWKERRKLKKFIKTSQLNQKNEEYTELLKVSPLMSDYLRAQQLLARQCLGENPFAYHLAELFNPTDGEIFSVHPGTRHLKKIFMDRLAQHDGQIRSRVKIESLLYRSGVFEGVSLGETQGNILAKYFLWNHDLSSLAPLLPRKWRFWKLRRQCARSDSTHHWFTVRFSVPENLVPEPMKDCVIDLGENTGDPTGGKTLLYQLHRNVSPGLVHIDVSFLLESERLNEPLEFFKPYFETARQRLLFYLPFAQNNLKFIFPTSVETEQPATLFPIKDDEFEIFKEQARHAAVHSCRFKNFIDLFQVKHNTPSPNFYISHPQVFSHFGIESKLMLGLKITDLIWQEVDKTKKRAMKSERRIA